MIKGSEVDVSIHENQPLPITATADKNELIAATANQ